jgi:Anti-sigma-K factor rskA, C-terminal
MQQQVKETPIDAAAAQLQRPQAAGTAPHKREATRLWSALAGMALSLALACVIVMLEFTSQAAHRANRLHRHAEALLARVSHLQTEVAGERARVVTARRELAAAQALRALLRAPDAGMLLLAPPAAAGGHNIAAAQRPKATLALAPKEHRAVLIVAGLKTPAGDTLFVLWWRASHGAPVRAAGFRTAADGSALVTAAMPPGLDVTGAMVTAERVGKARAASAAKASAQRAPAGPVQLRGTLAR